MTEEQKKYYNAMKKLGSKKPQKPIPRPQVPAFRAPPPAACMRLLPKGATVGRGQNAACALPTRLCPWREAGSTCREGRQQLPDKLRSSVYPLPGPAQLPSVQSALQLVASGARAPGTGRKRMSRQPPSEQRLQEKDEGLLGDLDGRKGPRVRKDARGPHRLACSVGGSRRPCPGRLCHKT